MLPLVVQVEKVAKKTARTYAFRSTPVRVGRNPLNDLRLSESFVSQWHGVIRFDEDGVRYLDLGSTNSTMLDGQPIRRNVEMVITPESDLRIGDLRLHVLRDNAPPELFGGERRSAFAQTGHPELGDIQQTMYLPSPREEGLNVDQIAQAAGIVRTGATPVAESGTRPVGQAAPVSASANAAHALEQALPADQVSADGCYASYRRGWSGLLNLIGEELRNVPPEQREAKVAALQTRFPAISREPEFRKLVTDQGVNPLVSGEPDMADWFRRLTDGMFPPIGAAVNSALAMERVGNLLEVFASAFIELRNAQNDFCREMSLEPARDNTTMWTIDEPHALLALLLDPGPTGGQRPTELMRAMADFTLHQVALVSAVVDGARATLEELSPDRVREQGTGEPARPGLMNRIFGGAAGDGDLWNRYLDVFEDLYEEDRFTRTLFGRRFARRYYSVSGAREPKK